MQKEELKPCPFCGGAADKAKTATVHYMSCTECDADGPFQQNAGDAAAAWNRRAIAESRATVAAAPSEPVAWMADEEYDLNEDKQGDWPAEMRKTRRVVYGATPPQHSKLKWHPLYAAQQAQAAPDDWKDQLYAAMERAFAICANHGRQEVGGIAVDDTQAGVEFAMQFIEKILATPAQSPASPQEAKDAARDKVRDAVAQALVGTYYCGRAWEAWHVGTMRKDDFTPAEDIDDLLYEIVDAAIAAMSAPAEPQPSAAGGAQDDRTTNLLERYDLLTAPSLFAQIYIAAVGQYEWPPAAARDAADEAVKAAGHDTPCATLEQLQHVLHEALRTD